MYGGVRTEYHINPGSSGVVDDAVQKVLGGVAATQFMA